MAAGEVKEIGLSPVLRLADIGEALFVGDLEDRRRKLGNAPSREWEEVVVGLLRSSIRVCSLQRVVSSPRPRTPLFAPKYGTRPRRPSWRCKRGKTCGGVMAAKGR